VSPGRIKESKMEGADKMALARPASWKLSCRLAEPVARERPRPVECGIVPHDLGYIAPWLRQAGVHVDNRRLGIAEMGAAGRAMARTLDRARLPNSPVVY